MDFFDSDFRRFLDRLSGFGMKEGADFEWTMMLLQHLLNCEGKWHIEDGNLKLLRARIYSVFQHTYLELQRLRRAVKEGMMLMNTGDVITGMAESLKLLKPDIQRLYAILSNSSRASVCDLDYEYAEVKLGFLDTVVIEVMLISRAYLLEEEVNGVREGLMLLRNFIGFIAQRCSCRIGKMKDLLIFVESVLDKASCLLYLCFADTNMNYEMVKEIILQLLSELLKNISPAQAEVGKIYIKALKTSKFEKGIFQWDYLHSFLERALNLSDKLGFTPSYNRNQIVFLVSEVRFLSGFLDDPLVLQDLMCNSISERVIAVIIDAICSIIYSLHKDEKNRDEAKDFRMAVYDLQQVLTLKRKNATEAAECIYLPRPWRFLGPNPWGEIFYQLKFLRKQRRDKLICLLKDLIDLVLQELKPLKRVFTEIQTNCHEELEIQRRSLVRILDHTNFVITSFKHKILALWSCKLELYNVIQRIRMIKMEVGNSINRFTDGVLTKLQILSIVGMLGFEDQLRCLESNMNLTSPLKDEVQILRLKASFLRVFLNCKGKWHIEDGNLKVILNHIQNVFQNANVQKLWPDFIQIESIGCWSMPMNMENMLSSMQQKLQVLYPHIQQVYTILSKFSRYVIGMTDEAVVESLHSLLENIGNMLKFNVELVSHIRELEDVEKSLRFLIDFICFTAKRCSKHGMLKDLLVIAEILTDNFSCLLYLCSFSDKLNYQMMKEIKMQFSAELLRCNPLEPNAREIYIKSLKSSRSTKENSTVVDEFWCLLDSLREYTLMLSNTKIQSINSIRDQILLLHEDIPFLITYFAMDLSLEEHIGNRHQIFMHILERTSATMNEIGYVISSLHNYRQNDIYKKFSDFLFDFCSLRSFRSNFPKTNGQGFIGSLSDNLQELLNTKADFLAPLKYHIGVVQEKLLSVREDFNKMAKQANQCDEVQCQWTCFIDNAYHIEYVIDSFLAGQGTLSYQKFQLCYALEEINTIKLKLEAIKNKTIGNTSIMSSCLSSQSSKEAVPSSKHGLENEKYTTELTIFPEEKEKIIEDLTFGLGKLGFISIVGMAGIGKTTLANSVFQHFSVVRHFHICARCCIGQVYDKRRLLQEILEQVTGQRNQCEDEYDLEMKLYRCIKGKRYLIFMDDIWSFQPWEGIRNSFPDDRNGSRIMFTSRYNYVGLKFGPHNYQLSPLSAESSWNVLEWKIFGDRSCPTDDLVKIGREIATNCKGIPLALDLIAGIIRGKDIVISEWVKVADVMKHYIRDPREQCQKALELSYRNLPEEIRPCFLYFSAFPEDARIRTKDLILLWIAEGFVELQNNDQRCLEDAAEDILNNLIGRNLVSISKRGFLGEVKATHIHDLLHDFATAKAKEERFVLKVDGSTLSCGNYQRRGHYRMSVTPGFWDKFCGYDSFGTSSRSLIYSKSYGRPLPWHLSCFKLLRVLYIPYILCKNHLAIVTLVHLRLLAVNIRQGNNILSEIHKLLSLETFILNNDFSSGLCLSLDEVRCTERLRHFCSRECVNLKCSKEKILEKSFQFDNLRTLCCVSMSYADDIEKIFKLMPNLVKLKVMFYNPDGGHYPFPKLDFLEKLEYLRISHNWTEHPCKIVKFPPYIKTLALSNFCLPWMEISELGKFENLEILKLKRGSFKGAIWDMKGGQFPKLKYLRLHDLDIERWSANEDNFKCLEHLHVRYCEKLKELPDCLAEAPALQKIRLYWCSEASESAAKIIKEEQEAAGNYQLAVEIEEIDG